jgi:hypothetical protein
MATPAMGTATATPLTGMPTATATVTPTAKSTKRTDTPTAIRTATPMELFIPRMNRYHPPFTFEERKKKKSKSFFLRIS